MARRARSICGAPGCPQLAERGQGRCREHRAGDQAAYDRARGSSSERGYGSDWARRRRAFLVVHPLCIDCGGVATDADHAPVDRRDLIAQGVADPDDFQHLQPRCGRCHKSRTRRRENERRAGRVPTSGKSTLARASAYRYGGRVIDWDDIRQELTGLPLHDLGPDPRAVSLATESEYQRRNGGLALLARLGNLGWSIRLAPIRQQRGRRWWTVYDPSPRDALTLTDYEIDTDPLRDLMRQLGHHPRQEVRA